MLDCCLSKKEKKNEHIGEKLFSLFFQLKLHASKFSHILQDYC